MRKEYLGANRDRDYLAIETKIRYLTSLSLTILIEETRKCRNLWCLTSLNITSICKCADVELLLPFFYEVRSCLLFINWATQVHRFDKWN
jgi:hypothetical protein